MNGWLRSLFAPKPRKAAAAPRRAKTVLPPSDRAALLEEAMSAHRAGRAQARDVLERALDGLRARVPKPGRDPDGVIRALSLQQAEGALRRIMAHDLKRFLALAHLRQLLGEAAPEKPRRSVSKR